MQNIYFIHLDEMLMPYIIQKWGSFLFFIKQD